jgi:hypothetical protein
MNTIDVTRMVAGALLSSGVALSGLGLASGTAYAFDPQPDPPGLHNTAVNPQPESPGVRVGFNPQPEPPGRPMAVRNR